MNNIICNSGGAKGSDSIFEEYCMKNGIKVNAFSYKTKYHTSPNKVEITDDDFNEGIEMVKKANEILKRSGIFKYINLLARNWSQVKYSEDIFAIGRILKPGFSNSKGFKNNSTYEVVDGGTGYAVTMGILSNKNVYVFDQDLNSWYKWSYIISKFIKYQISGSKYFNNIACATGTFLLNN
jgi:hypothetical protein